jgi:hypothetical protein
MKSFSLLSFAVIATLAACTSSADSGTASNVDGTSPTGTTPDGFCAKKCISDDRDECVAFAARFSDAFLAAFEACGDNPACLQPKLDAAPKTERQERLAAEYCAKCAGGIGGEDPATCPGTFFGADGPGASIEPFSDARLDGVEEKCIAASKPGLACKLSFVTCLLPLVEEDLGARLVCRAVSR